MSKEYLYRELDEFPFKKCDACPDFEEYEEREYSRCYAIEWALSPVCKFKLNQILKETETKKLKKELKRRGER